MARCSHEVMRCPCYRDFKGSNVWAQIVSGRPCFRQHLAATRLWRRYQRDEIGRDCFRRGKRRSQARGQGCSPRLSEKLRRQPALPVDLGAIERELLDKCGSVSAAARALGVSSVDLRRVVGSRPSLADVIYEGTERAIDEAVQVLLDGLSHPDKTQRLAAAAFLLRHTEAGRRRGWGRRRPSCRETAEHQAVTLKWID
jgi:hypothetical protein